MFINWINYYIITKHNGMAHIKQRRRLWVYSLLQWDQCFTATCRFYRQGRIIIGDGYIHGCVDVGRKQRGPNRPLSGHYLLLAGLRMRYVLRLRVPCMIYLVARGVLGDVLNELPGYTMSSSGGQWRSQWLACDPEHQTQPHWGRTRVHFSVLYCSNMLKLCCTEDSISDFRIHLH